MTEDRRDRFTWGPGDLEPLVTVVITFDGGKVQELYEKDRETAIEKFNKKFPDAKIEKIQEL